MCALVAGEPLVDQLKNAVLNAEYRAVPEITSKALEAGISPEILMREALGEGIKELENRLFGDHKVWVHPDFLMAMEGVRESLEIMEPLIESGQKGSKGTVVLGTPEGDTHDLGAKMLALALIAAGFKVDYLGRDVPLTHFIERVRSKDADILAISSYQTSGFKKIESLLDLLKSVDLNKEVKVMVGGTVITEKYAAHLKVAYARNASEAVLLAEELPREDKIMTKMTPAQRLMMSSMGQEPDRVPVGGVANDWAWGQLFGKDSFQEYSIDPERSAKVIVWACREMGSDMAVITADTLILWEAIADASGISPYSSVKWNNYIPTHPHRLYSGDPVKETAYGDPLIRTMADAKKLKPADPYRHGRLPSILKSTELAMKELGEDYPIGGMADIPLHVGGCLMGWTQMFIAMEEDPELWKTVEDVIIKSIWAWIEAQYKMNIRGFLAVSELPHKVGPEAYYEHPLWMQADHPPEIFKRACEELKISIGLHPCTVGPFEPGIPVWKTFLDHTTTFLMPECGGADALAQAKADLAPATMVGNINPVDIMLHGTTSEVEEVCVELIRKCGPGGRFILSTGCEIPLDTPIENVQTMLNSVRQYGKYPILE